MLKGLKQHFLTFLFLSYFRFAFLFSCYSLMLSTACGDRGVESVNSTVIYFDWDKCWSLIECMYLLFCYGSKLMRWTRLRTWQSWDIILLTCPSSHATAKWFSTPSYSSASTLFSRSLVLSPTKTHVSIVSCIYISAEHWGSSSVSVSVCLGGWLFFSPNDISGLRRPKNVKFGTKVASSTRMMHTLRFPETVF